MYDPMTVAFEIYLGSKKKKNGHYRDSFITIWHVDPESDGSDDSCGWTFPKVTKEERMFLHKVAEDQFPEMFARKIALKEEKSYAYLCYNQDIYGCIYWMWRHFNRTISKAVWQYGDYLSNRELQYVYQLAYNPVDNFQHHKLNTVEEFEEFLFLVYRCWKAYKRKWYRHPRYHFWHWKIQFHPFKRLKRRYWDKCCICGKRGFKSSAIGDWSGTKRWHQECDTAQIKSPKPM
jgi:hypothetical protein